MNSPKFRIEIDCVLQERSKYKIKWGIKDLQKLFIGLG